MKWSLIFLIFLIFLSFKAFSQKIIELKTEKMNGHLSFHIASIKDKRLEKNILGSVFFEASNKENMLIKGGLETALKQMFEPLKNNSLPIAYHILDFTIKEQKLSNNTIKGDIFLKVGFERIGVKDTVFLMESSINTTYTRSEPNLNSSKYETLIAPLFTKTLDAFDKWLITNQDKHEAFVKGLKITFLPEPIINDEDTVYYNSRKISWQDFKGKKQASSSFGAAIFTNFAYSTNFKIVNKIIEADVQTKTYMVKGMSWVSPNSYTNYALAHEQLHFDITKLVVARFKEKISKLQADNIADLSSILQYEYLESYREMNKLQKEYDEETTHSQNQVKQIAWQNKVNTWLEAYK